MSIGDDTPVDKVYSALAAVGLSSSGTDSTISLRPIYAPGLEESDPGKSTYRILKSHGPQHLEWWHFELQPPNNDSDWHDYADDVGLNAHFLSSNKIPKPEEFPPMIPWTGGAAMLRSRFKTRRGPEPNNSPGEQ